MFKGLKIVLVFPIPVIYCLLNDENFYNIQSKLSQSWAISWKILIQENARDHKIRELLSVGKNLWKDDNFCYLSFWNANTLPRHNSLARGLIFIRSNLSESRVREINKLQKGDYIWFIRRDYFDSSKWYIPFDAKFYIVDHDKVSQVYQTSTESELFSETFPMKERENFSLPIQKALNAHGAHLNVNCDEVNSKCYLVNTNGWDIIYKINKKLLPAIWSDIAGKINFTFTYIKNETHCDLDIMNNLLHVANPGMENLESIFNMRTILVYKEQMSKDLDWDQYFYAFSLPVWFTLLIVTLLSGFVLAFTSKHFLRNFIHSFLDILMILLQQQVKPETLSFKIFLIFWAFSSLVLFNSYLALLISFITLPVTDIPFKNLKEVAANQKFQILVADEDALIMYKNTSDPLIRQLSKKVKGVRDLTYAFNLMCNQSSSKNYLVQVSRPLLSMYQSQFQFCHISNTFVPHIASQSNWVIKENSPYKEIINFYILKLRESGSIENYFWRKLEVIVSENSPIELVPIGLETVAPVLVIMLLIIFISLCMLFCEIKIKH